MKLDTQTKRNLQILRPHPGDILSISIEWNAVSGTKFRIELSPEFKEVASYFEFEKFLKTLPPLKLSIEEVHSVALDYYSEACKILNDRLIAECANDGLSQEEWLSMPRDLFDAVQKHIHRREARKTKASAMTKAAMPTAELTA